MYGKRGLDSSIIENKIKTLTLAESEPLCNRSASLGEYAKSSDCYYSLSNLNPEDKDSLAKYQQCRLKYVLEQLQKEREDTSFSRNCLFCRKHFVGNRSLLLDHLMEQHNFIIGAPDNIVFINELLDILEQMLKNLQCFYCEKIFKDWLTLKEHMRKKQHKRINPRNKNYDKFYIINYLEPGKTWADVEKEDDYFLEESDECELDSVGWQDESSAFVCLFCDEKMFDFEEILQHMKVDHFFDFKHLKEQHNLNFYSQLKFINYLRRKMFLKVCPFCDLSFVIHDELIIHMVETGHISLLPDSAKWDQSMYYFSTFENDNLLCALDADDSDCSEEIEIYPEDTVIPSSTVLCDENIRMDLM